MIPEVIRLAAAIGVFTLSGLIFFRLINMKGELPYGLGLVPTVSFMLGLGAISWQIFMYSVLSIPAGFLSVAAPWALLLVPTFLLSRRSSGRAPEKHARKMDILEATLFLIIISQVAYTFFYALLLPPGGWDAWNIWHFKGRVFFLDRGVRSGFLTDHSYAYDHPDYPLLIPLSVTWIYLVLGRTNEILAKIIYPMQCASLLIIFFHSVKRSSGRRLSLLFTAMLSLTPLLMAHSAGLPVRLGTLYAGADFVGYSDLALSTYFLGAGTFFYIYMLDGNIPCAAMASLFLAMGAWTKNEGLPFAAVGGALILIHIAWTKRRWGAVFMVPVIILTFIAPWAVYKLHYGIKSEFTGNISPTVLRANIGRLPAVLDGFVRYMGAVQFFNLAWFGYLLSSLINLRGCLRRPLAVLHIMILTQLSVYAFSYVIAPFDTGWLLKTSLDRVILHLVPLCMMVTALNTRSILYKEKLPRSPADIKPPLRRTPLA